MQILDTQVDRTLKRLIGKADIVIVLILVLYPFEDRKGIFDTWLLYIDLGKTTAERLVFVKKVSKLLIGRCTDTLEVTACESQLVTPSRLGCINETLLSIEALKARNIDFDWCVNLYEDREDFEKVTQPYYDAVFLKWWTVQEGLAKYASKLLHNYSNNNP